jgi:hypothetical protein
LESFGVKFPNTFKDAASVTTRFGLAVAVPGDFFQSFFCSPWPGSALNSKGIEFTVAFTLFSSSEWSNDFERCLQTKAAGVTEKLFDAYLRGVSVEQVAHLRLMFVEDAAKVVLDVLLREYRWESTQDLQRVTLQTMFAACEELCSAVTGDMKFQ